MNHISYFYPNCNIQDNLNFLNEIPLEFKNKNLNLYWLSFIISSLENTNKFKNSTIYTNETGKKICELFAIPYSTIKIISNKNIPKELIHTYNLFEIFKEQNNPFIFTNKNSFYINFVPNDLLGYDIAIFLEKSDNKKLKSLADSVKNIYGEKSIFLSNYNFNNLSIDPNIIIINDIKTLHKYANEMINIIDNNIKNIKMQLNMSKKIIQMKNLDKLLNYLFLNNFLINYYILENKKYINLKEKNNNSFFYYYTPSKNFNSEYILYNLGNIKYQEHIQLLENYLNINLYK